MTNEAFIGELLGLLLERETFLITSHARPDGDAIGSSLGMMHLLEGMGKKVTVVFTDPIPSIYRFLPGVERIVCDIPPTRCDAAILLECGSLDRSSLNLESFAAWAPALTINIDHHLSGKAFATFNWNDPTVCAVGAMIYDVAVASGVEITTGMATCLYTAVLTDTGSFAFPGTTAATFALAEHLVRRGAQPSQISQAIYMSNPASKLRLLGTALSHLKIEGPIAHSFITLADMAEAGATVEDTEGVVNQLIGIAGVEAAVFLREFPEAEPDSKFRVSLRSKGEVNVAVVAEVFGGGGHRNASGCTLTGHLVDVTERLMVELRKQFVAA